MHCCILLYGIRALSDKFTRTSINTEASDQEVEWVYSILCGFYTGPNMQGSFIGKTQTG